MNKVFKILCKVLFAGYLFLLIRLTLFRTTVTLFQVTYYAQNGYITSFRTALAQARFIPFYSVYYYLISRQEPLDVGLINIFGNILLFVPFGFFLPLVSSGMQRFKKVLLVTLFTSLGLELTQLVLAIGMFDIDDTLLNTIGGALGYACFSLLQKLLLIRKPVGANDPALPAEQ